MAKPLEASEYLELTILPKDRIDLVEFAKALEAINSEYRQWLRDHKEFDHKDRELRLFVEKITEGSLKVFLSKGRELLFPVLEGFYKESLSKFFVDLFSDALPQNIPVKQLQNFRAMMKWDFKFRYCSPKRQVELETSIQGEARSEAQEKLIELLAGKEIVDAQSEQITFVGFHQEGNARIIASSFSDNEVRAFMVPEVRSFFLQESENFMRPNKQYLVDMQVHYRSGELEHYNITRVISS